MELHNDKEIVLEAVKNGGWPLHLLTYKSQNDKDIVLEAIKSDRHRYVLNHASDKIKNNKEIVLEAVKKDGWNLQYASNELKNDGKSLIFAPKIYQFDKKLIVRALKNIYFIDYRQIKYNSKFNYGATFNEMDLKKSFWKILRFY